MIPSHIKALILDMDGVIWRADSPIGNLPEIFKRIEARGLKYVFATNNGTKTPEQYVATLEKARRARFDSTGCDIRAWDGVYAWSKISTRDESFHGRRGWDSYRTGGKGI